VSILKKLLIRMKKESTNQSTTDLVNNLSHIGGVPLNPELSSVVIGWRDENGRKRPIFNLDSIQISLNTSTNFLGDVHKDGGCVLFVNTNTLLNQSIKEVANDTGHAFLNGRWIGGLLTNSHNIFSRIKGFKEVKDNYSEIKHKLNIKSTLYDKMDQSFSGLFVLQTLPDVIVLISSERNTRKSVIAEANKMNIPVVGFVDTSDSPKGIDYPIYGNYASVGWVKSILRSWNTSWV
jgi:small subunit ribosomal protein S2